MNGRRWRRWLSRALALLWGALAWGLLPGGARADNCSSLGDCYGTVASGLAATVGIALILATVVSLPSILSALESLAARSLGLDTTEATKAASHDATATPVGPTPPTGPAPGPGGMNLARPGGVDLSRGGHPLPPAPESGSLAKGPPGSLDSPGMPYEGSQAHTPRYRVAPPQPAAFGGPETGHDLSRGVPPATPAQDLSPAHPAGLAAPGQPAAQTDLSRAAPPAAGQPTQPIDLSRTPGAAPAASADPNLGQAPVTPASFSPAPHSAGGIAGGDLSRGAQAGEPLAGGGHDLSAAHQTSAQAGPESSLARGVQPGGAETLPGQPQTNLSAGQHGPASGAELGRAPAQTDLGAGHSAPTAGDQSLSRGEAQSPSAAAEGLARGGNIPAADHNLARGPAFPGDQSLAAAPPPTTLGTGVGAAVARQVLGQLPGLDHTTHLAAVAQSLGGAVASGADGGVAASEALHGLGLDAGASVDLGSAVVLPSADAAWSLRFLKASGAYELTPLDPLALAFLPAGAPVAFDPVRGHAAFSRFLGWVEAGAPRDALDRDPDVAAIRAAALTRIGQTQRAAVERALGPADQQWATGNLFLGYRLAGWPDYLYVFEFDAGETLRSQGFVATPSVPGDAPLAAGMTRDAVWTRLGAPLAVDGWWPFERWRYRRPDGRLDSYEFAHGILRAHYSG
ncbi:MAG: hypothetical protein ACTHMR_01095 [Thermomicrobiales bacterium]